MLGQGCILPDVKSYTLGFAGRTVPKAGGTVAASVVYLMGLGLWRCLERWLERWRRHLDLWLADARLEGGFRGQNTDTAFVLMMVITKPHGG